MTKHYLIYLSGDREEINLSRVMQYSSEHADVNPSIRGWGTGCDLVYIIQSIAEKRPILLAKTGGSKVEDIERVINTHLVKSIEVENKE